MQTPKSTEQSPAQRRQIRLVFYSLGVADVVLGAALAFLGPKYLGLDPTTAHIVGGLVAVLSLVSFWIGYYFSREPNGETSSGQVTRMRD